MHAALRGLIWMLLATALTGATQALAAGFVVQDARTRLVDDVYRLDAHVRFDLSAAALEALENGVPLTFSVEITIWRNRRYWLDERVARVTQRYRLEYHALTSRYVLMNMNSGASTTFDNLDEALRSMGNLENFPLMDGNLIRGGERYQGGIVARLDIETLPAPMRPLAYISRGWRLTSDRYVWSLQR
jgi:hypothetical protein